jgi:putative hydrolase of the HAD superfamily
MWLARATDPGWLPLALARFDEVLVDHAHCEKKAAAHALSMLAAFPEVQGLARAMATLAREEAAHLAEVLAIMDRRGLSLGRDAGDPYAQALQRLVRAPHDERLLDRLLVSALIEERSRERLSLLAGGLGDPELREFYARLAESEEGHGNLFLRLARRAAPLACEAQARRAGARGGRDPRAAAPARCHPLTMLPALAVTFDFGGTLGDLDTRLLSARLRERSLDVSAEALEAALGAAWRAYDAAIRAGVSGHPWHLLMRELLIHAGGRDEPALEAAVAWLWSEQPRRNLWRRPVPGMLELVRALRSRGVPLGIVSNSEGKLAELAEEMGIRDQFDAIADSGALGVEKPSPAIFQWVAERLRVPAGRIVHVGDSWAADVQGALGAGLRAIWFRGEEAREAPEGVRICADAGAVASALREWGIP